MTSDAHEDDTEIDVLDGSLPSPTGYIAGTVVFGRTEIRKVRNQQLGHGERGRNLLCVLKYGNSNKIV